MLISQFCNVSILQFSEMLEEYKTGDADKSTTRESQNQGTKCKEVDIPAIFLLCMCEREREREKLCVRDACNCASAYIIATCTLLNYTDQKSLFFFLLILSCLVHSFICGEFQVIMD